MSGKPDCFGRDIEIRGLHGYLCRKHPNCLLMDDCYGSAITTLYINYISKIAESEEAQEETKKRT